jgi:hypothetical protein
MIEAGVVIAKNGEPIHWHLPPGRTSGSIPDTRSLWDIIWDNRDIVSGFAHSHPGSGIPGPSYIDVTTFSAIEAALGRRLFWWITSSTDDVVCRWKGPGKHDYISNTMGIVTTSEREWLEELRRLSYAP